MTTRIAWLLNLDADRELEHGAFTPGHALEARMREARGHLATLVGPDAAVIDSQTAADELRGFEGRAWCPTPSARSRLVAVGATPPHAPPLEVLRRVNSRRFSAELGSPLPGARFVDDEASLRAAVDRPLEGEWCLKTAFSTSGSGRRRVRPGALSDDDARWAVARLAHGLQVEPWLERLGDFAIHGHLDPDGRAVLGEPCVQRVTPVGSWLESALAGPDDLDPTERLSLVAEARRVASALHGAGYFGPFNVDAFRYRTPSGSAFQPRCEINARYTMGWAIGMGTRRPDLDALHPAAAGLRSVTPGWGAKTPL